MCLGAIYGLYKIPQVVTEIYTCKILTIICGIVVYLCAVGMLITFDAEAINEEPTDDPAKRLED
jgi:hypothetical protein